MPQQYTGQEQFPLVIKRVQTSKCYLKNPLNSKIKFPYSVIS
jgi:hypothetical protein